MYSVDLKQFTLDEFETVIGNAHLTKSRQILKDNLAGVMSRLRARDINDLAALKTFLRKKIEYPNLAAELATSVDYLTVLNREVNSYISKPVPLAKLEVFTDSELAQLAEAGLKSSKNLYENALSPAARKALSERVSIAEDRILGALELCDLLRINGVGPVFARILREMDIHSAAQFSQTDSQTILDQYHQAILDTGIASVKLSINDIDWCKRFGDKLDVEIEW